MAVESLLMAVGKATQVGALRITIQSAASDDQYESQVPKPAQRQNITPPEPRQLMFGVLRGKRPFGSGRGIALGGTRRMERA